MIEAKTATIAELKESLIGFNNTLSNEEDPNSSIEEIYEEEKFNESDDLPPSSDEEHDPNEESNGMEVGS